MTSRFPIEFGFETIIILSQIISMEKITPETHLKEIKVLLSELNKKLDSLLEEKDTCALMLWQRDLDFLEKEPDIYSLKDIKAQVNCRHSVIQRRSLCFFR